MHFCRPPPPRSRLCRKMPMRFCRHPPPRPRLRRSSPAPPGAGAVLAISGEQPYPGWSRWETVPGSSPGSPHVLDRGDIATGGGADGEGELVPPPLSPTLQPSNFSPPSPSRASCRLSIRSLPAPPPRRGPGQCPGVYQGSSRIRGVAGGQPCGRLRPRLSPSRPGGCARAPPFFFGTPA